MFSEMQTFFFSICDIVNVAMHIQYWNPDVNTALIHF